MSDPEIETDSDIPTGPLRRGWTTGTCATAAARAAYEVLVTGACPATVEIGLPSGQRVAFAVTPFDVDSDRATAGVVKDAGDDPDVTHGALIKATVVRGGPASGVTFRAGEGVGTVTKPGLPIAPGEPAINPVPRAMMQSAIAEAAAALRGPSDVVIEISVPGGEAMAAKTLNGRLGIVGGISILGTTGIVVPYSCAAWIHSIHRGIDVARATEIGHIAGSTGSASEGAVQRFYDLPDSGLIEMGDFAGGMLKYLKRHTVSRVTIAGGFAKMVKLGQGLLDLHSKRGQVDIAWLADVARQAGASEALRASLLASETAQQALIAARCEHFALGDEVAERAWRTAAAALDVRDIALDVLVFDRTGALVGRSAVKPAHVPLPR